MNICNSKNNSYFMAISSLTQTNVIDILAAVLTYLKQKNINVIEEILKKFDDMPDDCETNALIREPVGIHKVGDYCFRMMKWLILVRYFENINHYDLIATVLIFMKGERLCITKELFLYINEWK